VVVFAHVPPPHHGQSYAVQLLIEQLRKPAESSLRPIRVYHVDARLSDDIDAIGRFQPLKILRLFRYCFAAIGHRIRNQARILYYIPAAPMRSAVYRDWIVMILCRPFFHRVVFHWEAAGLAEWLARAAKPWERALTLRLLAPHDASVILAEHGRTDAECLRAREVWVVPNGIPDPCPDCESRVAPARRRRLATLQKAVRPCPTQTQDPIAPPFQLYRAVYLSLCVPEKGLFDALDAVALANAQLKEINARARVHLTVAGRFWREEDRVRFDKRCRSDDLLLVPISESQEASSAIHYAGFLGTAEKARLLESADVFLFPSYYSAESFGLAVAEAMAFGVPVIATRWRHLPELFPTEYPFLVEPRSPAEIADALIRVLQHENPSRQLRERFLRHYTVASYGRGLREAILGRVTESR